MLSITKIYFKGGFVYEKQTITREIESRHEDEEFFLLYI